MTKKIFSPLLILILSIGMSACSGDQDIPSSELPDYPKDPNGVIDKFLKWFTEAEFKKIAPLTYPGGTAMNGQLAHASCYGAGNKPIGASETFYTYKTFTDAIRYYPEMFIDQGTGDIATEDQQKEIIAAYFANVAQETNGSWGAGWDAYGLLCYAEEDGYSDTDSSFCGYEKAPNGYCYNGRGPLQITHNYNYTAFSEAFFGDDRLAKDPREVSQNPTLAFVSSFWFFSTYNKSSGWKDGLSQFIINPRKFNSKKRDFAYTIYLINGGIECGSSPLNTYGADHRGTAFKAFYQDLLGKAVDSNDRLDCKDMTDDSALSQAPLWP